ncbi:MAG: hypothetical protein NT068_03870 [Candidatus Nomurabacteria bacterium]|nr:hypothetical protein [Candidatus Nomurabacteria bacterium]
MEILAKLLGGVSRVKIMRLFLLNPDQVFENKEISKRSRVQPILVRKDISHLAAIDFIKKTKKGWSFNPNFIYADQIESLLVGADKLNKEVIAGIFKKAGRVKLLLVAGTFIKNKESRVDLLIVGDNIKRKVVEEGLKKLEAEIGSELTYSIFDTAEFFYRIEMYDKLVRDILDFPYEVVLETKELSTQMLKKN